MIQIDEQNLKAGVLGLVFAVVEILRDALETQAARRMESGSLSQEEIEQLGRALEDLGTAIADIKREQGLEQAVQSVRGGLDDLVNDVVEQLAAPFVEGLASEANEFDVALDDSSVGKTVGAGR